MRGKTLDEELANDWYIRNYSSYSDTDEASTMNNEVLRDNVDAWIKQIRREYTELADLPKIVEEHAENIQHNYELIYELRDDIDELKQEMKALKLIQIIALKNKGIEMQEKRMEETEHGRKIE